MSLAGIERYARPGRLTPEELEALAQDARRYRARTLLLVLGLAAPLLFGFAFAVFLAAA